MSDRQGQFDLLIRAISDKRAIAADALGLSLRPDDLATLEQVIVARWALRTLGEPAQRASFAKVMAWLSAYGADWCELLDVPCEWAAMETDARLREQMEVVA